MDCPARWESIGQILERILYEMLLTGGGRHDMRHVEATWEALTRFHFAQERKLRSEIDTLARSIAKQQRPPEKSSPAVRYYLALRLSCAMDFLGMVFPPQVGASPFGEIRADWSDQRVIEWLLIDLWVRRFDHWLKLDAISAMGPFAFYGLEPADPTIPQ